MITLPTSDNTVADLEKEALSDSTSLFSVFELFSSPVNLSQDGACINITAILDGTEDVLLNDV